MADVHTDDLLSLAKDVQVDQFNDEHKRLIGYIQEFRQIIKEIGPREPTNQEWRHINGNLSRLTRFTITHFKNEEEMMEKHNFHQLPDHRAQHQLFLSQMRAFSNKVAEHEYDFKIDMEVMLLDWILSHINISDTQYGPFYKEKGVI